MAKSIDLLFQVPYNEKALAMASYCLDKTVLERVGVLKLIHKDLFKTLCV